MQNLETSNIFIAILSEKYEVSEWTDQECGFALAKKHLIIPLIVNNTLPYGFINKLQALRYNGDMKETIRTIVSIIRNKFPEKDKLLNLLIKSFASSRNYTEAGRRSEFLLCFDLSKEQINKILEISIDNNQICEGGYSKAHLHELMDKYREVADNNLVKKLQDKIGDKSKIL